MYEKSTKKYMQVIYMIFYFNVAIVNLKINAV